MPGKLPEVPNHVLKAFLSHLEDHLWTEPDLLGQINGSAQEIGGLALYSLPLHRLNSSGALGPPEQVGWRVMYYVPGMAAVADVLQSSGDGSVKVNSLSYGAELAADYDRLFGLINPQARPTGSTAPPRLLRIPEVYVEAIWTKVNGEDRYQPVISGAAGFQVGESFDASQFLKIAQQIAKGVKRF